jgi:hypothetical protein
MRGQPCREPLQELITGDEEPILIIRAELQIHGTTPHPTARA